MKNKKLLIALITLVALAAVMVGVYFATRPQPDAPTADASKTITVTVVHSDGTEKVFTYQTDKSFLGPLLYEEGLIEEGVSAGMFDVVDGEKADWNADQSYWALYIGGNYATKGVDATPLYDGDSFRLVYTRG